MPSAELLSKFADAYKIPIRELLQDEDQHMELVSRLKIIEILLENAHSSDAESMIKDLENHPELSEKDRISLTLNLSECRYQQSRHDEVLSILQPLVDSLEIINYHDVHTLAWIRNKIGNAYTQMQDTVNAYYNYKKALDLASRFPVFDSLAAYITYNVGLTLRRKGRNMEAAGYLERAGHYFEQTKDMKSLAHTLFVQGIAYKNIGDHIRATDLLEQSTKIYQTMQHYTLCHSVAVTLASSVLAEQDPNKALTELENSLQYFENKNDCLKVVFVISKIVTILVSINELHLCDDHLNRALKIIKDQNNQHSHEIADFFRTFSNYLIKMKQYDHAKKYALKSSRIYDMLGMFRDEIDSLKIVVECYKEMGDFKKAFEYQTLRNDLLENLQKE